MLLATLAMICISLTILAYCVKRATIAIGAAFSWLLFALHGYNISTVVWDIEYCAFWFGIGMMLAISIESAGMKIWANFGREHSEENSNNGHKAKKEETTTVYIHPSDKMRAKHGLPPSAARGRRRIRDDTKEFYKG